VPQDLHKFYDMIAALPQHSPATGIDIPPQLLELRWLSKSGKVIWIEQNNTPVFDRSGKLIAIEGVARDISARKQAEQQLRDSEARWQFAIEGMGDGLWDWNAVTNEVFFSTRWKTMLGYAENEIGNSLAEWDKRIHVADKDPCYADLEKYFRGETPVYENEHRLRCKDGSYKWVLDRGKVIAWQSNGKPARVIGTHRDISAQKTIEAELRRARDAAETANRAKSAFLANMSHELRTPLNAVMGYAQILSKAPELSAEHRHMAQTINRSGDYLLTLLNDVLDLAKIEAGRYEILPTPCQLSSFLHSIVDMFRIRALQKGLGFEQNFSDKLPARVEMDEKRIRQILNNLLANAVKFTDKGYILLCCNYNAGRLYFTVRDTGVGIEPEQHQEIFKPFEQIGEDRYKSQGAGLGLNISRKLAQLMGGELELSSHPGQGSSFHFSVPVKVLDNNKEKAIANAEIDHAYPLQADMTFKVLVVDDNADNRELIKGFLSPLGVKIQQADSGEACLAQLQNDIPDVIFMDLKMPGLNGLETTRRIRAMANMNFPIIAVSASVFQEDREKALSAGCTDYLAKPLREIELYACLKRYLPTRPHSAKTPPAQSLLPLEERLTLRKLFLRGELAKLTCHLEQLQSRYPDARILLELARAFNLNALKEHLHDSFDEN
jgi:PAS domain S-box-containing protein